MESVVEAVVKPAFKRLGGSQAGWVWLPHLNKKRVLFGHTGKGRRLGGSNQKGFDHHAFNVGNNVTNVFYSVIKAAKGVWGLASQKDFHNYIFYNAEECSL